MRKGKTVAREWEEAPETLRVPLTGQQNF